MIVAVKRNKKQKLIKFFSLFVLVCMFGGYYYYTSKAFEEQQQKELESKKALKLQEDKKEKEKKEIEKAILTSDIGINPNNDGKLIRLNFPELNEERRKELVKEIRKMGEDSKVAIRSIRRDGIDEFKTMQKNSEITEDDLKMEEDSIQKITDENIDEIDKLTDGKEKEIMTV